MRQASRMAERIIMNKPSPWQTSPTLAAAAEDEVHVWRASLIPENAVAQRLEKLLSADEMSRASQYRFNADRRRFVTARGVLREILGHYLQLDPIELAFCYDDFGKPAEVQAQKHGLNFNLSHSGDLALFAIALNRDVGIDVEIIRKNIDVSDLAERSYSPAEVRTIKAHPQQAWFRAFFTIWTRKEAYIKARGRGLSLALDSFDVTVVPGEPVILWSAAGQAEAGRWFLQDLELWSEYVGALAASGGSFQVKYFQWSP